MIFPIKGILEPYSDQGTEGIFWSMKRDGFEGYDALVGIDCGDYLTIYKPNGYVDWEGEIQWNEKFGGDLIPVGFDDPVDWAYYFFPPRRCELVKAEGANSR